MDRALFHVDGPYYWPEFHAIGVPCKTIQPPHTAFRGFGGPVSETIVLGIGIFERNLYFS
jgi:xanthine dehydrogenase molybdopterin-binding subunit B